MLVVLCVGISVPAWSEHGTERNPPGKRLQQLLDSIDRIRTRNNIAALGLALVDSNRVIWSGSLGVLSHKNKLPANDTSIFRIGSISKTFTGLAALKLQEQGFLELSDPVTRWSTQNFFHNAWRNTHPVSIDQLLEHTAGLQDMTQPEWDYSKPRAEPLQQTLSLHPEARRVQWQPGMHASYSNAGAGLVGFVLEQAAEKSYEAIISSTLFKPLDMVDSSVLPPRNMRRLATGYDTDGNTKIPYWHVIFRPAAGINSTPADMANFVQMLINKGRFRGRTVISASSIERMETPATTLAARHGLGFGYGLGNYQWLREGVSFHGHGGDADGYLSRYGYTRSNNSGYFLIINAFQGRSLNALRRLVERYLIEGVETAKAPAPATLSVQRLAKISGSYQAVTTRFAGSKPATLEITERAGQLFTRVNRNNKTQLIPVSNTLYRRKSENLATIAIVETADGNIYFQGSSGNFVKGRRTEGNY